MLDCLNEWFEREIYIIIWSRTLSEVEHVRDILVDEQPYQEWIPSDDLTPEEKACSS